MKTLLLYILLLAGPLVCLGQYRVSGRVQSATDQQALPGASIRIKSTANGILSDAAGNFSFSLNSASAVLTVSYKGFATQTITLSLPLKEPLLITMAETSGILDEVLVSTGYQQLPPERVTGSFTKLDADMLNRRVGTNILDRIEDLVPGLLFNRGIAADGATDISIRGRSTLVANDQPLIVLDNFPYDGNLGSINPNDIESISVLKDAAAASIWGARAGNGVIVITSKKGSYNRGSRISFNSNVTTGQRPDLFYQPQMSSAEFIDLEKQLFAAGYYQPIEQFSSYQALTPVVELLIAKRDGLIPAAEADAQVEALKKYNVRNDFSKYLYRRSVNQQYALNINGGGDNHRYYLSGGLDRNRTSLSENEYSRITLNAANAYSFFNKKLEISAGINYAQNSEDRNNPGPAAIRLSDVDALYPYARLAGDQGQPLAIAHDYRAGLLNQAQNQGLLNWRYSPLEDLKLSNNKQEVTDYRINTSAKYTVITGLKAELLYQYSRTATTGRNLQSIDSYYTRNQVNRFTRLNADNSLTLAVPAGDILDMQNLASASHSLRGQMNYETRWKQKHDLSLLAGWEAKQLDASGSSSRLYGYNDDNATSRLVDYINPYPQYYFPAFNSYIINRDGQSGLADRFLSWYGNGAYTFDRRYTLTASARIDQSNLFGVKANQKAVPLWSAGLGWDLSKESFYQMQWLPDLKFRATYGYNGNVDKTVTAYTTALSLSNSSFNNLPYALITNPPNPDLRWERVKIMNLAADFRSHKNIISGSIDVYFKRGLNLIGSSPIAPSTGMNQFTGNTASTSGRGLDISLSSRIIDRSFKWYGAALLSFTSEKVTRYNIANTSTGFIEAGEYGSMPIIGNPLFSVYSYPWAGLNGQTGNPQGYLNGAVSEDYTQIINGTSNSELTYHGPARPVYFGAFRNTLSWKNISLSANISFRMGYYFRKESLRYTTVLNGDGGHGDYSVRWKKPGDELLTNVPSQPALPNYNRDYFYLHSASLVEKGDHVRFQDINLSYGLTKAALPALPFNSASVYLYANNLGLLWKATDSNIDPDYAVSPFPPVRTIALGLKVDF